MSTRGIFISRVMCVAALVFKINTALAVVFTNDTVISLSNFSYDGTDLVVSNCTLTVDGPHAFASLLVGAGGTVTHTFASSGVISETSFVFDEPQTLVGTNPVTLLSTNVSSVISVADASQPIFYSQGADWAATILNGVAQVQRTTNSTIPDGENVL